ncbi:DNA ligase [Candidatus Rubidus massiliensis]|nr:DNA ligase [Candidatus Rubidus massiliensis]
MSYQETLEEYLKLCETIWYHNRLYYAEHNPEISDEEYDFLYKKLIEIEKRHPEWIHPTSPSQRVNESITEGFETVSHKNPMLSLANSYSKEEVNDFIRRVEKLTAKKNWDFTTELKMDGIAVSVRYEKGVLVRGVTRGDGKKGDDITNNIKTIQSLPLKIYHEDLPDILEVRGEVFMPHATFKKLNDKRRQRDETVWANPRNAAAGSLKLLNPKETAARGLSIAFYGLAEETWGELTTQWQIHQSLKKWGLPTLKNVALCHSLEDIWHFVEQVKQERQNLPFDIDGVVIKLNNLSEQKRLGVAGKNPRWAVAYKFAAEKALTRLNDITIQVGRTGVLTPVAELEPVFLAGSTISRATLHNIEEIERKDIRIGDYVYIEKGGDVIPKVISVDLTQRTSEVMPWIMPNSCPSCHAPIHRSTEEVALRCMNSSHCPEQQLRRIIYFASKDAIDIEHLGEKVVEQLFTKGFIKKPSDIYKLTSEDLFQLDGFKEKSVNNLLNSIQKSKETPLARFILALGIKHVGAGIAEILANRAGSIETLSTYSLEDLMRIDGIGEKVADSILAFFHDPKNQKELDHLLKYIKPQTSQVIQFDNHIFQNKTFVLTGSLNLYTRDAAAALIKERGGKVVGSVSRKTDFILAGIEAGSKLEKGKELGIRILSEEEFVQLL